MYISDLLCISPQQTYDLKLFKSHPINYSGNKYVAVEPDYKELIPAATLRRMGKITRMGVGTGLPLLRKHAAIDGIIIGTANGGVDDSMKFLNQIEQYQEGTLTPTNFMQSTPNSLAGLLAMMSNNSAYNITHVHEGLAFNNALLDAQLFLEENKTTVLVGAAEEISEWNFNINQLKGFYKKEIIDSSSLFKSNTAGTVCGEGAAMFVLGTSSQNALAQIKDIAQITSADTSDVIDMIKELLIKNDIKTTAVDALVLGINGNAGTDNIYKDVYNELFEGTGVFTYKNLIGDYPTSSAFALWLSTYIIQINIIPSEIIYIKPKAEIKNILIYNHYNGLQHGAVLVSSVKNNQ